MNQADSIAIISVVLSTITALSAIIIAFLALQQTAHPRLAIQMTGPNTAVVGSESTFKFEINNVGHWYAAPAALNVTAYFNFEPIFELRELRYGSYQELVNSHVRIGKHGLKFIRAQGIKLSHRNDAETVDVFATPPNWAGRFRIAVDAFSENGASCQKEFWVRVVRANEL